MSGKQRVEVELYIPAKVLIQATQRSNDYLLNSV